MDSANEVQLHYVIMNLLEVRQGAGHIDLPCALVQDSKSGTNIYNLFPHKWSH